MAYRISVAIVHAGRRRRSTASTSPRHSFQADIWPRFPISIRGPRILSPLLEAVVVMSSGHGGSWNRGLRRSRTMAPHRNAMRTTPPHAQSNLLSRTVRRDLPRGRKRRFVDFSERLYREPTYDQSDRILTNPNPTSSGHAEGTTLHDKTISSCDFVSTMTPTPFASYERNKSGQVFFLAYVFTPRFVQFFASCESAFLNPDRSASVLATRLVWAFQS